MVAVSLNRNLLQESKSKVETADYQKAAVAGSSPFNS